MAVLIALVLLAGILLTISDENPWWIAGAVAIAGALVLFLPAPRQRVDAPSAVRRAQQDQESIVRENNRRVALMLATEESYFGMMARQWLKAYDADPSVPPFAIPPYWWTETLELISLMAFTGLDQRLDYVSHAAPDDTLLALMTDDLNPQVRRVARWRSDSYRAGR